MSYFAWLRDQLRLDRPTLTAAERNRLDQERREVLEASNEPTRSDGKRLNRAGEQYVRHAGLVAASLVTASATVPPPATARPGTRRGSDASDPTLSQLAATHAAIEHGARSYAHLLGPCPHTQSDPRRPQGCPPWRAGHDDHLIAVATAYTAPTNVGALLEQLHAATATRPRALADAVTAAAGHHATIATALVDGWHAAARATAHHDLVHAVDRTIALALRMRQLADRLAHWAPETTARRCAAGCGAAVPDLAPGAQERGGATCDRCRKARSRSHTDKRADHG